MRRTKAATGEIGKLRPTLARLPGLPRAAPRSWRAGLLLALSAWIVLLPAAARSADVDDIDRELSRRATSVAQLTEEISAAEVPEHRLQLAVRSLLDDLDKIEADRQTLLELRKEPSRRLSDLGPPPAADQPPESGEIARLRKSLSDDVSRLNGLVTKAELIIAAINRLIDRIRAINQAKFFQHIEQRSAVPFSRQLWSAAAEDLPPLGTVLARRLSQWRGQARSADFSLLVAALAAAGALLAVPFLRSGRRAAAALAQSPASTLVNRQRRVAAGSVALGLLVACAGGLVWLAAAESGLIRLDSQLGMRTWLGAVIGVFTGAAVWLSASPGRDEWRLLPCAPAAARRVCLLLAAIVALFIADRLSAAALAAAGGGADVALAQATVSGVLFGTLLWLAARRRNWVDSSVSDEQAGHRADDAGPSSIDSPPATAAPDGEAAAESTGVPVSVGIRQGAYLRAAVRLLALILLVLIALGYIRMADFLAHRIVLAGVFLTFIWSLRVLARWGVESIPVARSAGQSAGGKRADQQLGLLLDLVLDLTLAGLSIPVFLLIVGFDWLGVERSINWLDRDIRVGAVDLSLRNLATAVVSLLLIFALTRWMTSNVDKRIGQRLHIDESVRNSVLTIVNYLGLTVGTLTALSIAGFSLSQLALIAGALSVGIGFGLQGIVTNFVAGLIVLFQRLIKIGDWIVVQSGEGYVRDIGAFSTEIETFDHASILIPNSELISSSVQNWFYKSRRGRLKLKVGVSYDADPEEVRKILLEAASDHRQVLYYPRPTVVWTDFGDSALEFCLRAYVGDYDDAYFVTSDLRFAVFKALTEGGISIPYPQRDIHVRREHADAPERPTPPTSAQEAAEEQAGPST